MKFALRSIVKRAGISTGLLFIFQTTVVAASLVALGGGQEAFSTFSKDWLSSWVVWGQWGRFVLGHGILYGLFFLSLVYLAGGYCLYHSREKINKPVLSIFGILLMYLLVANQVLFPLSLFSWLPDTRITFAILYIVLVVLALLLLGIVCVASLGWYRHQRKVFLIAMLLGMGFMAFEKIPRHILDSQPVKNKEPNIIIMGIDSLRYDFLNNPKTDEVIPHIKAFMKDSFQFSKAYTPFARTFPAWISVLTGNYSPRTKASHNLRQFSALDLSGNILPMLKSKGYHTWFAMDDRRFNNIDERYGFDHVIGPQQGMNDFVLSAINDTPLSNLWVNRTLGKWLFPFNHANRADYVKYTPKTFVRLLRDDLPSNQSSPVFIGIHLCLPHWPFVPARPPRMVFETHALKNNNRMILYPVSLALADTQFHQIMQMLDHKGYLKNAIVILMSDHGESFIYPNENIFAKMPYVGKKILSKKAMQSVERSAAGHGTDIGILKQYHVMLGFQRLGGKPFKKGNNPSLVSLADIAPTVLDLLFISHVKPQAASLASILKGKTSSIDQPIYIETGLTAKSILGAKIVVREVLKETINIAAVDPKTGLVHYKEYAHEGIMQAKQRGVLSGDWMIAAIPLEGSIKMVYLAANLKTKQWTADLGGTFAQKSPATLLINDLRQLYGDRYLPAVSPIQWRKDES